MNPTQHTAKTLSVKTGFFAVPFASLRGGGSGAPAADVHGAAAPAARRPLSLLATLALAIAALLALVAPPASARVIHTYQSQITEAGGSGFCTASIATDSTGDLYLGDNCNGVLDKLDSSGATVSSWGTGGQITEVEGIHLSNPTGLATDSSDNLWVSETSQGTVFKFDSAGNLLTKAEGPEPGGAFPFGGAYLTSVAWSDAANRLFVADSGSEVLWAIEPNGSYSGTSFSAPGCCSTRVAADNSASEAAGDLYVSTVGGVHRIHASGSEAGEPHAFSATAPYIEGGLLTGTPIAPFGEVVGLAVDFAGNLYVAQRLEVDEFAPSGRFLGRITGTPTGAGGEFEPFEQVNNVAVGPTSGNLYVGIAFAVDVFDAAGLTLPDVTTLPAEVHSVTDATLAGEVNAEEIALTECFFEYGQTTAYGEVAECEPEAAALGNGNAFVPVEAQLSNLIPGATYHYRLVAANANGANKESGDQEFFTGASVDITSVSAVSATTATLEAELNPHGLPTTSYFEYDTVEYTEGGPAHGTATPDASAGSGTADVLRTAPVAGLQPSTTYHFRAVATNSLGTATGPDRSFTTQGAAASTLLPDSRGWELVSPPDKHGSPLQPISERGSSIQAAADGSALAYIAKAPVNAEAEGSPSSKPSQVLARRLGPGAWSTRDIASPHEASFGNPLKQWEYLQFSPDLSRGALEPAGTTPLAPSATSATPYLRANFSAAGFCDTACYQPLVTACPAVGPCSPATTTAADVPPGTEFGSGGKEVVFVTATPDLSHQLLTTRATLVEGFDNSGEEAIYEWSEAASPGVPATLQPVNYIPPLGASLCGPASPACLPAGRASVGNRSWQVRNAISANGSRVVFEADATLGLYLRDLPGAQTLRLDAAEAGLPESKGGADFQFASTDGSRVFFTDDERLTADSTATANSPDLYLCQVREDGGGRLECDLTDLTANSLDPTEPAAVQGAVIGAAADGSSVYYVANGALTAGEGAVNGDCGFEGFEPVGHCNLYRYDLATGSTRLVAVLSGADFYMWDGALGSTRANLGELTARVSPNGRYLAFMSERSLTGYDNRDIVSGARDQEVFLYDSTASSTEALRCASCNPTGARPHGVEGIHFPGLLVDGPQLWQGRWLAASIPGWDPVDATYALYQSRYLSDSGRLFFNAADSLVPADSNGVEDVYQFEFPQGPGQPESNNCTTASSTYSPASGGCVSLISSGTSGAESAFLDASESGDDVFFLTASKLTEKDVDKALDVYDARVGGSEPQVIKPVECSGDACQQPAIPPNDATPGSLTFNGAGNLKQCPKAKKLKHGRCVAQKHRKKKHHRKHHHTKRHRRANDNRRAGR